MNQMHFFLITGGDRCVIIYRVFRKTCNIFYVQCIHNFVRYRSIWYM